MLDWSAEIDVPPALARALVEAQFAELRGERVARVTEGWDNVVCAVGDAWLFRFPRRRIAVAGVEREIAFLPRIGPRLPIAVPAPAFVGAPSEAYPWPFFGYRRIEGREACAARLDEGARIRVAPSLARALAALHAPATFAAVEGARLPPDPMGRLDFGGRLAWGRERLASLRALDERLDFDALDAALRDAAEAPRPEASHVVHGDLHFRHLLVDERAALAGVIDWGDVQRSDPAVDLQLFFSFLPRAARDAFEATYGAIPDERKRLARGVATYHAATMLEYGLRDALPDVVREARIALHLVCTGELPRAGESPVSC